ncbi:MAG: DUF4296 domain-containing protein [Ferruginibacter sp.]
MIRKYFFIPVLFLFISCGNKDKVPSDILKPEKMQAVLWDVIKADAYTTEFIKNDTAKNAEAENIKLQQQIFAIHKITKADFYNSYDYYKSNTVLFKKMLDSMILQAERNKNTKVKTKPLLEVQ